MSVSDFGLPEPMCEYEAVSQWTAVELETSELRRKAPGDGAGLGSGWNAKRTVQAVANME